MQTISFNELADGAFVRVAHIGAKNYLSIRDIIMVVCEKDNNRASEVWRLLNEDYKANLQVHCTSYKFQGRGQSSQPVITFDGALELIMLLPGSGAKDYRSKACSILKRYLAGDASLVAEIAANAESNESINVLARADDTSDKKRLRQELLEDLEIEERRLAIEDRRVAIEDRRAAIKKLHLENDATDIVLTKSRVAFLESLCPNNVLDDRSKLMIRDLAMNSVFSHGSTTGEQSLALTNGEGNPKSVSDIVTSMGLNIKPADMITIGKIAAKKYVGRNGSKPNQHPQFVGGRSCLVNHFVEKDHDLVREAVEEFTKAK